MKKLGIQFYNRKNVVAIAKELIGKIIVTRFDNIITSGIIVETEAYIGITDQASHSFGGRRTARNEHMYSKAGTVYVYICYGMHHLFNVVTNEKNIPDAVLIRAVEPLHGINDMLIRTGKKRVDSTLTRGPGNVSKALGISKTHSGLHLKDDKIFIYADEKSDFYTTSKRLIGISSRVGIKGAGSKAVSMPYRFYVRGNKFVSGYPNK